MPITGFATRMQARHDNEIAFEVAANLYGLSLGIHRDYRHDAVYIAAADLTHLAGWREAYQGVVTRTEAGPGFAVWTLRTHITTAAGVRLPVQVATLALTDDSNTLLDAA